MCGLAGVIFRKKRRRADERDHLAWLFTGLLILSKKCGPHATGAAWLDVDGRHRLFKRPVTAERFVTDKAFTELLASMDNRAALLLGHTRWRTRGDERVNSNNHPTLEAETLRRGGQRDSIPPGCERRAGRGYGYRAVQGAAPPLPWADHRRHRLPDRSGHHFRAQGKPAHTKYS